MDTKMKEKKIHLHYWGNQKNTETRAVSSQFPPPKLPYSYSALSKIADATNIKDHYFNFHWRSFEVLLDELAHIDPQPQSIIQLLQHPDDYPDELVDSAAAVYNHQSFWDNLSPYCGIASIDLLAEINSRFGTFYRLKDELIRSGSTIDEQGWLWLVLNKHGKLDITNTPHNLNPLMKHKNKAGSPLLAIDLWDHAYENKFHNNTTAYLNAVWGIINWSEVSARFKQLK
ncbi:superoxide dismutase [Roseimarinus sediminis]|uniref:superoxide dismutase n=1 Tax=Roseimarinus sediminis TaxID=1610899 RepID=UPI003D229263